jgi:hypothetical protein
MDEVENVPETGIEGLKGTFVASLKRNNKQIRDDRAVVIVEDARMLYKREIEDLATQIRRKEMDRNNMVDLSGNDTTKIINPSDFDAVKFVAKDLEMGIDIRNLEIRLEIAKKRFATLFE